MVAGLNERWELPPALAAAPEAHLHVGHDGGAIVGDENLAVLGLDHLVHALGAQARANGVRNSCGNFESGGAEERFGLHRLPTTIALAAPPRGPRLSAPARFASQRDLLALRRGGLALAAPCSAPVEAVTLQPLERRHPALRGRAVPQAALAPARRPHAASSRVTRRVGDGALPFRAHPWRQRCSLSERLPPSACRRSARSRRPRHAWCGRRGGARARPRALRPALRRKMPLLLPWLRKGAPNRGHKPVAEPASDCKPAAQFSHAARRASAAAPAWAGDGV